MHDTHTTFCVDTLLCAGACALEPYFAGFCFLFFYCFYFIAVCLIFVLFLIVFCVFLFVKLFQGVVRFLALPLFYYFLLCCCCCGCVTCLFLLSLCVDGALVCAEGYTQVTGVMAMMMTGRVLLVCALCLLWCGAGGRCEGEDTPGPGSDAQLDGAEILPESEEPVTSPESSQGLPHGVPGVKENVPPAFPTPTDEEDDDEDDGEENEDEEKETQEESIEGQGDKGGTVLIGSGSRENNLSGSGQEKNQSIAPAEDISHSKSQKSNANPTQPEFEEKKEADKRTPSAENPLTTGNGEHTLPEGIAEGNPPSPPEGSVASRKQDGEDTKSEDKKNVPPPATAAKPQRHRNKGSEGTGEDTKATTVAANKTDTTNTQNSDGSTAVSHSTSPLLLLFLACAAAAAVVAA
ncbi:Mucin-associated surface protein (MASP) subgroup S047 [Trypanosoma cruzi]|uniref:Mucin-associated surface protein (MASP) subgroup S047 n=1 Tax=Trypanosoma cruzi TaxID=5693 RepID=A0A7J6XSJ0_TRYCR|nr:Mucin-associated surface protein (MASP) subgroup S047 [Trypanosoma cruzi]